MKGLLKRRKKLKAKDARHGFTIANVLDTTSPTSTSPSKWKAFAGRLNPLGKKDSSRTPTEPAKGNEFLDGSQDGYSPPHEVGSEGAGSLEAGVGDSEHRKAAKVNNTIVRDPYSASFTYFSPGLGRNHQSTCRTSWITTLRSRLTNYLPTRKGPWISCVRNARQS